MSVREKDYCLTDNNKMKKLIIVLLVLLAVVGCKKELVKEPKRLIAKEKMINIMYDLSLLEVIKYQSEVSLDSMETNPHKFILQKYQVDSLQFMESNKYYAADYKDYKNMIEQVSERLKKEKKALDAILKKEDDKERIHNDSIIKRDSLAMPPQKIKKDSIKNLIKKRRERK
jgi:hypothetical protein